MQIDSFIYPHPQAGTWVRTLSILCLDADTRKGSPSSSRSSHLPASRCSSPKHTPDYSRLLSKHLNVSLFPRNKVPHRLSHPGPTDLSELIITLLHTFALGKLNESATTFPLLPISTKIHLSGLLQRADEVSCKMTGHVA